MEVFSYNPDAKNESLEDFNGRLGEFCADNPVVDIQISTMGRGIFFGLTLAEDAEIQSLVAIIPNVVILDAKQQLVPEKAVGEIIAAIAATDSDDNPAIPFKATLHQAQDVGYAVILVNGGEIDLAEEPGAEGEEAAGGR
jgi:hypothetical protein